MDTEICGICREEKCDFVTRCDHFFHEKCIKYFFETTKQESICPYCRSEISTSQLIENICKGGFKDENLQSLEIKYEDFYYLCDKKLSHLNLPLIEIIEKFFETGLKIDDPLDENGTRLIHLAAYSGNLNILEFILSKGANINSTDNHKEVALHVAVDEKDLDMVKALVTNGADLNLTTDSKCTPLHYACDLLNIEIVRYLIEKGATVNPEKKNSYGPIDFLFQSDADLDIIKLVYENGVTKDINDCFHRAIFSGKIEIMKYFLEKGADINQHYGRSHLHYAAGKGTPELINFLLDNGADINSRDKETLGTPIFFSLDLYYSSLENLKIFVERGADLTVENKRGMTIFQNSCIYKKMDAVEYLMDNGADLLAENRLLPEMLPFIIKKAPHLFERVKRGLFEREDKNLPILHTFCETGNYELFMEFVEKGFDVNFENNNRETPLFFASCPKIIDELFKRGVDVNHRNNLGMTPLMVACKYGNVELFRKLISHKDIDIFANNLRKQNILHCAAQSGIPEFVQYFIKKGLDVNQLDRFDLTPVYYIKDGIIKMRYPEKYRRIPTEQEQLEVLKLFEEAGAKFTECPWDHKTEHPVFEAYNKIIKKQKIQ